MQGPLFLKVVGQRVSRKEWCMNSRERTIVGTHVTPLALALVVSAERAPHIYVYKK